MVDKTILVVGTYDTKNDELDYMVERITAMGGGTLTMDVSVLGDPQKLTDISKHQVAQAADSTIEAVIISGDENSAMQLMTTGACKLARQLFDGGKFDGIVILGGTMGTDLALDVCKVLPLGVPKYVVSTVSFSPLIPPERLASDIQMILWGGGLYGLNSVCKSSLSQAAGAVLGAARAVEAPNWDKPLIGMTSFGKTVLRYMVALKPALEERGFEVAVFHATGMGGRAFEGLAAEGAFAAVMDFAPQEVTNHHFGSNITAGADRMTNAGRKGIPQMIAPGCYDLVDFVGWQEPPARLAGYETHAHNRLLSSAMISAQDRGEVAQVICGKLAQATGTTEVFLPLQGCNEWDREGAPLHDAEGLKLFMDAMRQHMPANVSAQELDCHINDADFAEAVLATFDKWLAEGVVTR